MLQGDFAAADARFLDALSRALRRFRYFPQGGPFALIADAAPHRRTQPLRRAQPVGRAHTLPRWRLPSEPAKGGPHGTARAQILSDGRPRGEHHPRGAASAPDPTHALAPTDAVGGRTGRDAVSAQQPSHRADAGRACCCAAARRRSWISRKRPRGDFCAPGRGAQRRDRHRRGRNEQHGRARESRRPLSRGASARALSHDQRQRGPHQGVHRARHAGRRLAGGAGGHRALFLCPAAADGGMGRAEPARTPPSRVRASPGRRISCNGR